MLNFGVKSDFSPLQAMFDKLARGQIPFATSLALNRVAEFAKGALRSNMAVVFDRPKPYVLNSLFIKRSTKTNLVVVIAHSKAISPYLKAEIEGGVRSEKRFEITLGKDVLVPTNNIKRDGYGGVSKALIARILSAAQSGTSKDYILVRPGARGKLSPGVYQRKDGKVRALFLFKSQAHYEKRYDMAGVVGRVVKAEFGRQFAAQMDYALSTAKVKLPG